jgi:hypothetical protein
VRHQKTSLAALLQKLEQKEQYIHCSSSKADVDRVGTTEETLLLSNLQAEIEKNYEYTIESETVSYGTA